eukprot:1034966-Amorphochlora_amoeboformis.AAC.1
MRKRGVFERREIFKEIQNYSLGVKLRNILTAGVQVLPDTVNPIRILAHPSFKIPKSRLGSPSQTRSTAAKTTTCPYLTLANIVLDHNS